MRAEHVQKAIVYLIGAAALSGIFLLYQNGRTVVYTRSPLASSTPTTSGNDFLNHGESYSATSTVPASPDSSTATLLSGMHRTFNDDFATFSRYVDSRGEVTCDPGGSGTWQTVYYFCSRTSPGNYEAEIYIDPSFLSFLYKQPLASSTSESPFTVRNGTLVIKAMPASALITSAAGPWAKYTTGMITTQYSFSQKYGYFEIRAKVPAGKGLWPAFWLLPTDKNWPPEVDVFETFGAPNPAGDGPSTALHYASHALVTKESCGDWHDLHTDLTKAFHVYGVDIEPTGITYFFDGLPYASCPPNSALDRPLYMLVNLAVGSAASWPGAPDVSTPWPAELQVDYVRAYQKN